MGGPLGLRVADLFTGLRVDDLEVPVFGVLLDDDALLGLHYPSVVFVPIGGVVIRSHISPFATVTPVGVTRWNANVRDVDKPYGQSLATQANLVFAVRHGGAVVNPDVVVTDASHFDRSVERRTWARVGSVGVIDNFHDVVRAAPEGADQDLYGVACTVLHDLSLCVHGPLGGPSGRKECPSGLACG